MKPLTIEELEALEVFDWVWIVSPFTDLECSYAQKVDEGLSTSLIVFRTVDSSFWISDYGTEWLAYKNKEQAEGKGDEIRKQMAKEILDEVSKHYGGAWLVELYKKYGVEVDE